jgi:glycosyltransferase EpsH
MNNKPLVSIIVPVYNVEQFLPACLDSILSQTYTKWECVLVDDGSKDGSGIICDEFAAKDSRFVVVHKQNEGVAKARITAFEHSKGELITFADADDYVSSDYLSILLKGIMDNNADMVSCDYYIVQDGETKEPSAKLTGVWEHEQVKDFIIHNYFYDKRTSSYGMTNFLWTKMIKRSLVHDALSQGVGLWYGEDQIAIFHALLHCKKLALIPDRLYFYVQHPGQAIKKYDFSLWENQLLMIEKYEELDKEGIANEGRRVRIWGYIITTLNKMMSVNLPKVTFCDHLSKMRGYACMKTYFRPFSLGIGGREELKYWLIKTRLFHLLYILLLRNRD